MTESSVKTRRQRMRAVGLALIAMASMNACSGSAPKGDTPSKTTAESAADPATAAIAVEGMVCTGCESAIQERVSQMPGVIEVVADHKAGSATVHFDAAQLQASEIVSTITELGYTASLSTGPKTPASTDAPPPP